MSKELSEFRNQLKKLDEKLIHLLNERLEISKKIGIDKKKHQQPVMQQTYWDKMCAIRKTQFNKNEIEYMEDIFKLIHSKSIQEQNNILRND